jgi:glycosyltransferase involved in cell wall biosynthesis
MPKQLVFAVTNDLNYDQRMQRICSSLVNAGYKVTLIGRTHSKSKPLFEQVFKQKRFKCFFEKGKFFYIEYQIKLFFTLLFTKADLLGAIDLDTILPVLWVSKIKGCKRLYDAHELFCEMEEISTRPSIYKIWKKIEQYAVPKFKYGYTVCDTIAEEFKQMYNSQYLTIRNATLLDDTYSILPKPAPTYILYQGAVNKGRSFETLIPAMQYVNLPLIICGAGNFFEETKALIEQYNLQNKITLTGYIAPAQLKSYTKDAYIGLTLFSNINLSKSNYLSLANRFFDYMHAGVPQLAMKYPEYITINNKYEIASLLNDLEPKSIAAAINKIIEENDYYTTLVNNTIECRQYYNWQNETKKLVSYYEHIFA